MKTKQAGKSRKHIWRKKLSAMAVAAALGVGGLSVYAFTGTLTDTPTLSNVATGQDNTQAAVLATTTANNAGTQAVTILTVGSSPASNATLTVGTCVITFTSGSGGQDTVNCAGNSATIDLTTDGSTLRSTAQLSAALRTLTNVAGGTHGALTASGSGNSVVFTSANKVSGNPALSLPTGITSVNTTPGVAPVAQVDTLTISGVIEYGDLIQLTLPTSPSPSTVPATGTSPGTAASALATVIPLVTGYSNLPFTVSASNNTVLFTAKTPGTGFSLGPVTATNAVAQAQLDIATPGGTVTAGEVYFVVINGTRYQYMAQAGDTAANIVSGLKTAITSSAVTTSGTTTLGLTAATPGTPFTVSTGVGGLLTYSSTTFDEAGGNVGTFQGNILINLSGDTFSGSNLNLLTSGKATISNLPAGLTATLSAGGSSLAMLTLGGATTAHAAANSINNLTLTFADSAFTGGNASAIAGSTINNIKLAFVDTDTTAPTTSYINVLKQINPSTVGFDTANNASNVITTASLALNFSEAVTPVTGKHVVIKKYADDSVVETIDLVNNPLVGISPAVQGGSATKVAIAPGTALLPNTQYYVLIDAGAFVDTAPTANAYAGISSKTALSFTTGAADTTALVPGAGGFSSGGSSSGDGLFKFTLSKPSKVVAGKHIVIKKTADNSIVETLDISDALRIKAYLSPDLPSTTKVEINPATNLANNTSYYLNIEAGAFVDTAGHASQAITSTTDMPWNTGTDTRSPIILSATVSNVGISSVTLNGSIDEQGTYYYVILPTASAAPTATQVVNGQDAGGSAAAIKGSVALVDRVAGAASVSGLSSSTGYKAYVAARDPVGNISTLTTLSFNTDAPFIPPVVTVPTVTLTPPVVTPPVDTTSPAAIPSGGTGTLNTAPTAPVVVGAGSTVTLTAGASGATITLPTPASGTNSQSVTFAVGGATINVVPTSTGTTLGVKTVTVNGVPTTVLSLSSGSVSLSASSANQPLLTIGNASNPVIVTADGSNTVATIAINPTTGSSTITVTSGSITLPGNLFAASSNTFAAIAGGKVYAGETVIMGSDGKVSSVRLGSTARNSTQAGDPIAAVTGVTFLADIPRLTGIAGRTQASVDSGIAQVVGAALKTGLTSQGQRSDGTLALSAADLTIQALPLGSVTVDTDRANAILGGADGTAEVAFGGLISKLAPGVADLSAFAAEISRQGGGVTIMANGLINARLNGATYVLRPSWLSTKAATAAAPGLYIPSQHSWTLVTATGQSQVLAAAFADPAAVLAIIRSADAKGTLTETGDGNAVAVIAGKSYTLSIDARLVDVPASHAKDAYWIDGGKVYVRYAPVNLAQGFEIK